MKKAARMNTAGNYRDLRSSEGSLEAILNESEYDMKADMKADMKYELQGLKNECAAMVKDLVGITYTIQYIIQYTSRLNLTL